MVNVVSVFLLHLLLFHLAGTAESIGVNYGTVANNLPTPSAVAAFLKSQTAITRVKLFDANADMIRAFSGTGIRVAITVGNGDLVSLADPRAARRWVNSNVRPFWPGTNFSYVLVGTEVLHWGDQNMVSNLVKAMRSVHNSLLRAGLGEIKVSTAHSLGILASSDPPSSASFRPGWAENVLAPVLLFHRKTKSPFMVNPYPYFSWTPNTSNFSLFRPNPGVFDPVTRKNYTNVYTLLLDAVYSSMKKLGYGDVEIAVGEVGWPSAGFPHCTVENARWHNLNVKRIGESGQGTPMMPGRKFETYIFALFNENLKPGNEDERNFGLFRPDFSSVYDIGIMRDKIRASVAPASSPEPSKQWCVPKVEASEAALQANINWACSEGGVNCEAVQAGGPCYNPNTVRSHAAYVMNAYYQAEGHKDFNCDFASTGLVTISNPSYGACEFEVRD